ncbi:MAG: hypothetical protein H6719_30420 [Sandaracinaceae bacterium]|nr:hypothetical protein [Sandaracinaceae bacterium]
MTDLQLPFARVLGPSVVMFFALGCAVAVGAEDDAEDDETGISQDALTCSGGCCGSAYNCGVPDPRLRDGCGGARIRNGSTGSCEWPLRADAERSMYDGLGNRIGEVRSDAVRLNQGIRKHFGGRWLVYAFAATIRDLEGNLLHASGWIEQADLVHASALHGYTLALGDPGNGYYETRWRVVTDGREDYVDRYLHAPGGARYPATDYLVRPFGLVHLTYSVPGFNLGGHATDSFPPGAIFRRARGVSQIDVPLYGPRGYRSSRTLHFVYGYVHDGEGRRYGWLAKEALAPVVDPPAPTPTPTPSAGHDCSARCCDGTLATGLSASDGGACVSASSPVCADHGYVLRARFDESLVYERDRFCWSKCANREAYHRVDGVTSGCTDAARAYCAVGDRGAFEDAIWDACQPR